MSHNEYTRDLYSANLVTIFNSINTNDQQIDEELMQEFGSAHAAYQDVPEVVNTVHDNSSPVDLDIEDEDERNFDSGERDAPLLTTTLLRS